ncbi:MAG: ATP-binding protein [Acidimicrobiia bacterium]|jgi:hypothetical protein|nr:ATP-binding protein [Gemmatimonadota bacterium]MDH5373925.1 ATP-binding protein [Acidimicrobiia bacterium]MDH5615150.1 ATP-binding protein [Acidimicrobiia bacterium]
MDPIRNPYSPGAGSPPPALVGRDTELEAFDIAVQRLGLGRSAKSLMLTGLRGVGKTVLLREFGRTSERHGWIHQQIEATEDLQFPEAMAMLVRKALLRLSAGQRLADRARRAFGVLKSFQVRWKLPDGGDVTVGLDPVLGLADSGVLEDDLAGLFTEVGELAQERGIGVLFTIDEIQYLSREHLAALIVGLHRISQEQLPFMVAGAGLPSLPALAGEAKSYAERLFTFTVIDSLATAEAKAALATPAQAEGVLWHGDALGRVVAATEGYPYFLQEFGKEAWDIADGPDEITLADVDAAIPIAINELDTGFFRVRIDRTTDTERAYLAAMASLGAGPYGSGEVAAAMGKTTTQVGPHRDTLIKRGLCYSPRHGIIAFTVPMFDQFVRRSMG